MPLYDCLLLAKSRLDKERLMDLVARLGRHIYQKKGVLTDIKSFGLIQLGYGIKKLDGKHYQGKLVQMTMMVPPTFPKELHYLNKEDRLLRWLVVKHRGVKYGLEFVNEDYGRRELSKLPRSSLYGEDDEDEDDEDDDDQEYEAKEIEE